jgi:hypothetical protein
MMRARLATELFALVLWLCLFVYLVLALAEGGSGSSCHWVFPRWFGCVLSAHETLAGALIGAAGVLIGAWIAWTAVQQQINADHHRLIADRVQAEQLLEADLTNYAEGMAAAWCLLVALSEQTTDEAKTATREATAYMARQLSRADRIANYRAMSNILGWDRRVSYIGLIDRLDDLRQFSDADEIHDPQEVLGAIRHLADQFELCLPNTSHYFDGLWRRSPKAMSFADYVRYIGGVR